MLKDTHKRQPGHFGVQVQFKLGHFGVQVGHFGVQVQFNCEAFRVRPPGKSCVEFRSLLEMSRHPGCAITLCRSLPKLLCYLYLGCSCTSKSFSPFHVTTRPSSPTSYINIGELRVQTSFNAIDLPVKKIAEIHS
jgi:hypothetical protein